MRFGIQRRSIKCGGLGGASWGKPVRTGAGLYINRVRIRNQASATGNPETLKTQVRTFVLRCVGQRTDLRYASAVFFVQELHPVPLRSFFHPLR